MASDIWLRTILIVRKETRCRHIGYSYRLTARVLLYAPSHRQDNTYHSHGALAETRNSSMGPPHEGSIRRPIAPWYSRCYYTKSNPIDDHSNISSKKLQKQNFKPLGHYTCMQYGTSHLKTVQENILSHIILATYRKFTVTTLRFTQNVSCNIYTHPR